MDGVNGTSSTMKAMLYDRFAHPSRPQCRNSYGAHWNMVGGRCPNLIPTTSERAELGLSEDVQTFVVDHTNSQARFRYHTPYESMAHMWSSWYSDYLDASFPR